MSITLVILCFLHGWRLLKEGGRERGFLYIALQIMQVGLGSGDSCMAEIERILVNGTAGFFNKWTSLGHAPAGKEQKGEMDAQKQADIIGFH